MFHRRLLMLMLCAAMVTMVLGVQMARLTLVQGAQMRQEVETAVTRTRAIPTVRGRVLDRRGRVLAADRPSYDVCVSYSVITGDWAYDMARRAAYRANRSGWGELNSYERELLAREYQQPFDRQMQMLWRYLADAGDITPAELEERKASIVGRVQRMAGDYWMRRLEKRRRETSEETSIDDVVQPIREQHEAHAVIYNVQGAALASIRQFMAMAEDKDAPSQLQVWNEVKIDAGRQRQYPLETVKLLIDRSSFPGPLRDDGDIEVTAEGVGMHVIGMMRRVWKEDLEEQPDDVDPREAYQAGDLLGSWGIERSHEQRLRGLRGLSVHNLETGKQVRQEPVPGQDVVLTLDVQLQARVQAILDPSLGLTRVQPWQSAHEAENPLTPQIGDSLNAAAIVLHVPTGDVLAAVSMPAMSLRQLERSPESIWNDRVNEPYVNRVVGRMFQPGSTVKPLVLASAVTAGKLGVDEHIVCNGHLLPDRPKQYRCWIYKGFGATHGPLAGPEAIARSCNIFFYTLGRRMGAQRMTQWYERFDFSGGTGSGLVDELPGELPDLSDPSGRGLTPADAIFLAIGQGPIRVTPLQMANAYAALARGGKMLSPRFVTGPQREAEDMHLNRHGVRIALEGLDAATNESYGTGHHLTRLGREPIFTLSGVKVMGKSGTAQAVPLRVDSDGDDRITSNDKIVRTGDHAWFVAMVQRAGATSPEYVVAVVVEFGGSGGAVTGPVVNQILYAMRVEGYL